MLITSKDSNPDTFWHVGEVSPREYRKLSRRTEEYAGVQMLAMKLIGAAFIVSAFVGSLIVVQYSASWWWLLALVLSMILGCWMLHRQNLPERAREYIQKLVAEGRAYESDSVGYRLFVRRDNEAFMAAHKRAVDAALQLYRGHMEFRYGGSDRYWFLRRECLASWVSIENSYLVYFRDFGVEYSAELRDEVWQLSNEFASSLSREAETHRAAIEEVERQKAEYRDVSRLG